MILSNILISGCKGFTWHISFGKVMPLARCKFNFRHLYKKKLLLCACKSFSKIFNNWNFLRFWSFFPQCAKNLYNNTSCTESDQRFTWHVSDSGQTGCLGKSTRVQVCSDSPFPGSEDLKLRQFLSQQLYYCLWWISLPWISPIVFEPIHVFEHPEICCLF